MRLVKVLSTSGVLVTGSSTSAAAAFLIPISSSSSSSSLLSRIPPQRIICYAREPTRIFYRDDDGDNDDDTSFDSIAMGLVQGRGLPSTTTTTTSTNAKDKTTQSPSDFRSRMRRILIQQQKENSTASFRRTNVKSVTTLEEFASVIEEGRREGKMVVVRFHATWCKKCHALRPSFDKLAISHPHVTFIDVPILESNSNLHIGLGVTSVPFGHIYHPTNGLVVETKLSRQTLGEFVDLMMMHSSSSSSFSSSSSMGRL